MPDAQDHIAGLLDQLGALQQGDDDGLDALHRRTEMIIKNVFGPTSDYLSDLNKISFHPWYGPAEASVISQSWNSGIAQFRNLLNTMAEETAIFGAAQDAGDSRKVVSAIAKSGSGKPRVFLVHGHDDRAKSEVARFLELLDLHVVILHEQANAGRTIIEKFESESSEAGFAVVLLTADDTGSATRDGGAARPRARQNVVLELGYFLGTLGRSKVAALVHEGVELPSDYAGVLYIGLDHSDSWKLHLAREIKSSGLEVDLNKAI